jgi:hypothetical protein
VTANEPPAMASRRTVIRTQPIEAGIVSRAWPAPPGRPATQQRGKATYAERSNG